MSRFHDLLKSCVPGRNTSSSLQLSVLIKGARGAGKKSLLQSVADEAGFSVVIVSVTSRFRTAD